MQCRVRSCWQVRPRFTTRILQASRFPPPSNFINAQFQCRRFSVDTLTAVLLPPAVFSGLLVALWTYKCMVMVIFQNKIIYMPSVPPFSRSEKVSDYARLCQPVVWNEHEIKSVDGTKIKLLEGSIARKEGSVPTKHTVVVYFQGNASSLPPRLPYLSSILKSVQQEDSETQYSLVALSYRGFWTSSGRANQPGIELDTEATLQWVFNNFDRDQSKIVVWGQSIGAGAASVSLANLIKADHTATLNRISGLLLETPFLDLRAMLISLYPQKFLPYRYLAPFLRSTWDSKGALELIGATKPDGLRVLLLQAGDDELVPADNASILERICQERELKVERKVVAGALHTEVMMKGQGRSWIVQFLRSFGSKT